MSKALEQTLDLIVINEPVSYEGLHLFPLIDGPSADEEVVLIEPALYAGSLRVEELDEAGSVPHLRVSNVASRPVLILEGDELIGAKQDRTANSSVLVPARSDLTLPVSCMERGRWSYRSRAFSAGTGPTVCGSSGEAERTEAIHNPPPAS